MIRAVRSNTGRVVTQAAVALFVAALGGCAESKAPLNRVRNPWLGAMRVAVAPALNFSGSKDFDPVVAADLMASELSGVDGFEVLPVSRVLAVLARQGAAGVTSPEHALEIRDALGVDAILVFAVTEYQPYEPPVIGIAAQVYGSYPGEQLPGVDPVRMARSPSPMPQPVMATPHEPLAQSSGVYNAAHEATAQEVKAFAQSRQAKKSPFGWRKYTASQEHYLRFCCHAAIKELVQNGVTRQKVNNSL